MPAPGQHISDSWNSAEFYANKLLKEFRGVDENQVNWVKALKVGRLGALEQKLHELLQQMLQLRPTQSL